MKQATSAAKANSPQKTTLPAPRGRGSAGVHRRGRAAERHAGLRGRRQVVQVEPALQVLEPRAALVDAEHRAADGDCPGRHDQRLVTVFLQVTDIVGECLEPVSFQTAGVINQ